MHAYCTALLCPPFDISIFKLKNDSELKKKEKKVLSTRIRLVFIESFLFILKYANVQVNASSLFIRRPEGLLHINDESVCVCMRIDGGRKMGNQQVQELD